MSASCAVRQSVLAHAWACCTYAWVSPLSLACVRASFETYDRLAGDSSSTCIAQWSGLSMTAAFFAVPCLLFASLGCVLLVHWVYHKALHRHHMAALATRAKAATRSHARSSTGARA